MEAGEEGRLADTGLVNLLRRDGGRGGNTAALGLGEDDALASAAGELRVVEHALGHGGGAGQDEEQEGLHRHIGQTRGRSWRYETSVLWW